MKRTILALAICLLVIPLTYAQSTAPPKLAQGALSSDAPTLSDAEVRKVDKDAGKITLKHGEIKSLDMPAMTMVFQVKDRSLLDKVKTGDKVRFAALKLGGAFTITEIELVK